MTVPYLVSMSRTEELPRRSPHLDMLTKIAAELRVISPRRFVHASTGVHQVPPVSGNADPNAGMRSALSRLIYTHYYLGDLQGERPTAASGPVLIADREEPVFGGQLRNANTGQGYIAWGWTVIAIDGPDPVAPVSAQKDRLTLRLRPDQIVAGTADPIAPGAMIGVRFPKDRVYALAGFYTAVGDAGPPSGAEASTRWYVHLTPGAAPDLMADLTTSLNRLAVPFALKVLNHPEAYTRPDAGVLYLPRSAFAATAPLILNAYRAIAGRVGTRVPAFTRQLQPGLAIADEPPAGGHPVSFGQHRSRLIARGLIDAIGSRSRPNDRLDRIAAAFAMAGISLEAPHLNPGAPDYILDSLEVDT